MDKSALWAVAALAREIWAYRSHIAVVFTGDFRSSYRGTVLGVFWNFILPLVPISVYIMLVNLRVFPQHEGLDPAVYISFNVTLWMLFTGVVTRPMQTVKQRTQDAMKTAIPLTAAISASFGQLCFDTLVRLALVVTLVVIFGPVPAPHLPYMALAVMTGLIFCVSLGLILSIFNMIYPDVDRITTIIFQYGIFLSGVIFPLSTMGPLSVLEDYNPFNVFIKSARDFLFFGVHADMHALYIWAGVAVVLAFVAARFFYVMEHRIRELV
ncbi:MAG: ABC transporter permease [Hyphomonas sp.]